MKSDIAAFGCWAIVAVYSIFVLLLYGTDFVPVPILLTAFPIVMGVGYLLSRWSSDVEIDNRSSSRFEPPAPRDQYEEMRDLVERGNHLKEELDRRLRTQKVEKQVVGDYGRALQLECSGCGKVYTLGDGGLVSTDEEVYSDAVLLGGSSVLYREPDLVTSMPATSSPERLASVNAQMLDMASKIRASIEGGTRRQWKCHECRAVNDYGRND